MTGGGFRPGNKDRIGSFGRQAEPGGKIIRRDESVNALLLGLSH